MNANGQRIVTAHQDLIIRLHDLVGEASAVSVPLPADPHQEVAMRTLTKAMKSLSYAI